MRAIVYERYGPPEVLEVRELPSPVPARGEVLLKVHAAALNPKDSLISQGQAPALRPRPVPRGLGYDVSGVVAALGPGVVRFRVGDEVFGMKQAWAGGTVAEEVCLLESELAKKPAKLSFEEAAAIPLAALTVLQALRAPDSAAATPAASPRRAGCRWARRRRVMRSARLCGAPRPVRSDFGVLARS